MATKTYKNRKAETWAVKAALLKAGLPVLSVRHGTGTSWGWLHIELAEITTGHSEIACGIDCPACQEWQARYHRTIHIAQEATGRHGDHAGEIGVF